MGRSSRPHIQTSFTVVISFVFGLWIINEFEKEFYNLCNLCKDTREAMNAIIMFIIVIIIIIMVRNTKQHSL